MNGAIPYYQMQARRVHRGAKSGFTSPGSLGRVSILLCDLAHHVNNLLMRVQGYTSLMLMDIEEGQAGFDRLKHIENHIAYGAMLTSQLLACAGRGVYNDPVNIPPLLLEPQGFRGAASADYIDSFRIFIVGYEKGNMRSERLGLCRDISMKMAGLFTGIESVMMKGRHNRIEKAYIGKLRRATGEGARIAQGVTAVFNLPQGLSVHRYPASRRSRAAVSPVRSGGTVY